ncbi:UBP47-like protein [Mya arenaria]|uniref:Ubiquitin carboxyl-terminal hydrolase 47 n=1 Tax=Mya arenaria TaxID=6604 RepID=A0ABY7E9W0_MYAAR|nr:UBP47-like protein [Mya arenaria]
MVVGDSTEVVPVEQATMADERKVLCIVRDMVDTNAGAIKHTMNLQASMSVRCLINEVCKQFGYMLNTISLHYEKQEGTEVEERRHNLTIAELDDIKPQKMPPPPPPVPHIGAQASTSDWDSDGTASLDKTTYFTNNTTVESRPSCNNVASTSSYTSSDFTYASVLTKSETGYVGLVNQAMTCYLNSLLQTLYMTPEFRNAIYRFHFDSDAGQKSIPYQLQRLFLLLQTSKKRAVETTDLTKSFGWDSSEVWQQHDVQELCRVMFDALECGNESARKDTFLDIPLVIRPFGSTVTYKSISESLDAFVQPETLEGRDQYFCEKMSFPEILNLNYLIDELNTQQNVSVSGDKDCSHIQTDTVHLQQNNDDAIDEGIEIEPSGSGTEETSSGDELLNDEDVKHSNVKGPYIYELFSIMIHSGSAAGGHYYAYIKCLTDGQWYSFNDQHVSQITYDDIRKTYGGSTTNRGYYSSSYTSSANAYMLMYRQKDAKRNAEFLSGEDFPDHVKEELRRLNDKAEADRLQKELDKSTCKIKLYCMHPKQKRKLDQRLEIHKEKTLTEATDMAYKMFELEGTVPRDCVRLVKYDDYQDSLECSFEGEEETKMEQLLGGVYVADIENDVIIEPPVSVRAYLVQTVDECKNLIRQVLGFEDDGMRCVLERFHNDLKLLTVPQKTLKSEGFFKTNKVYIDKASAGDDRKVSFENSRFYELLDRYQNTINIQVNLPTTAEVSEYQRNNYACSSSPLGQDSAVESGVNSAENSVDNGSESCNQRLRGAGEFSSADLDIELKTLNLQSNLSQSDPNIYQNSRQSASVSKDEILQSLQKRGSRSSLDCQDSRSGSQSTQSTSTSAEFSLGNVNSYCDQTLESPENINDNDIIDADLSGHPPYDFNKGSDLLNKSLPYDVGGGDPVEHSVKESETLPSANLPKTMNSPVEELESPLKTNSGSDNFDEPCSNVLSGNTVYFDSLSDSSLTVEREPVRRFFRAEWSRVEEDTAARTLSVMVDKRITLGAFKEELEQYVNVPANNFKVYRVYSNNQEFESIRLGETLSFLEDGKINIKLGRALKNGEYRPCKFLLDTIFARGMTVLESKNLILPELKAQHNMDIPIERCRLRKKTWKNPGSIYTDRQVYEDEIPIYPNWEVFMEILDCEETLVSASQLAVYTRRWFPAKYELGPFEEVVISEHTVEQLKTKISELSGINTEDIEIAKGRGTFPYEVSLLEIHTDLDWNAPVTSLGMWPLSICDDGSLVYYRDSKEKLSDLSEEQRKEIEAKENVRISRSTQKVSYSPRKERALKIYTEEVTQVSSAIEKKPTLVTTATPDLD